jgi:long-chain acyl-CoA synthetase
VTGGLSTLEPETAESAQRRVAGSLLSYGLVPGDRVAFCLPSSAELLLCVLGALRRGVIPVLLNATLLPGERDALLADAEPALTILDAAALTPLLDGEEVELAPYPLGRPMHYTSGTTGRAKGVWSGVLDEDDARLLFEDEADLWGFDASDTHLVCSPMYHSVSIRFAAGTLLRGGRLVIMSRFDPAVAADAIVRHRPTTAFMAPTALQRLLQFTDTPDLLECFRLLVHAGSPCPPAVKQAALDRADRVSCGNSTDPPRASSRPAVLTSGSGAQGRSVELVPAATSAWMGTASSGAGPLRSPVSSTGVTPLPRSGPGARTNSPSATWVGSTTTATSFSMDAGTIS